MSPSPAGVGLLFSRRSRGAEGPAGRLRGIVMNVARMRLIDRWLGTPVCFLLSIFRKLFPRSHLACRPGRVVFVKLAEQGSTVLAQGALQAAIDMVGRRNVYFLLFAENRPILDVLALIPPENVIGIETRGLVGTIWSALLALGRLRRLGIDTAIDLEFFARSSAALCFLSGARWRVGYHAFAGEASYRGDLMTHRLSFNPYLHTSQAFELMVHALAHPAESFPLFPRVTPAQKAPGVRFDPDDGELADMRQRLAAAFG
jgi:ADP-heptose:LPS heptosyltransferase